METELQLAVAQTLSSEDYERIKRSLLRNAGIYLSVRSSPLRVRQLAATSRSTGRAALHSQRRWLRAMRPAPPSCSATTLLAAAR